MENGKRQNDCNTLAELSRLQKSNLAQLGDCSSSDDYFGKKPLKTSIVRGKLLVFKRMLNCG